MPIVNYTPAAPVAGTVALAAWGATNITTPWTNIQSAWTAFTSSLTATTTNPTLGTGSTQVSGYQQVGKWVVGTIDLVFGTSGFVAGSGQYILTLPVAANTNALSLGSGHFVDSSTGIKYVLECRNNAGTGVFLFTDASSVGLTATAPVVPANSDSIHLHLQYQAA